MRNVVNIIPRFHIRKPFLWAGVLLLGLAVAFTFLRQPIQMKTTAAPAVELQALIAPTPTPAAQPVASHKAAPRFVWKTVRENPKAVEERELNQQIQLKVLVGETSLGDKETDGASATTICADEIVSLQASGPDPEKEKFDFGYKWSASGGRIIGKGQTVQFDTTGLKPGDYTIWIRLTNNCSRLVPFPSGNPVIDARRYLKLNTVALIKRKIHVGDCFHRTLCFMPDLEIMSSKIDLARVGGLVTFSTSRVTGGREYGEVKYEWKASAGTLNSSGLNAQLDTTGITPGKTIEVSVRATSAKGCVANGLAMLAIITNDAQDVGAPESFGGALESDATPTFDPGTPTPLVTLEVSRLVPAALPKTLSSMAMQYP